MKVVELTHVEAVVDLGALPDAPPSLLTLEQFKRLCSPEQKADLINGVFVMSSPASYSHERLFAFLMTLLRMYVEAHDLGVVVGARMLVEVDGLNGYEPDICFIAREREDIIGERSIVGPPDLVVEIISPDSRRYDAYAKKEGYERLGVREYWLIDPDNRQVVFYRLEEDRFVPGPVEEGVYNSVVLPGFWLRVDWLWPDAEGRHPPIAALLAELSAV